MFHAKYRTFIFVKKCCILYFLQKESANSMEWACIGTQEIEQSNSSNSFYSFQNMLQQKIRLQILFNCFFFFA